MNFQCINELEKQLAADFPHAELAADWEIEPELCPSDMNGDITINCFRFAKIFKVSPDKIAESVLSFLSVHKDVEKTEKIKAFVNLTMRPEALFRDSVADVEKLLESARLPESKRKKIIVEYSAPNTNKPQHLGHVRNNTIGMSLVSLLKRVGHDAVPINLVNDRGIHICKSMIAYQRFGNNVTPESSGIKGDHLVGDFYVKYNTELNRQITELKGKDSSLAGKTDEELFLETEIGQATQRMLQDWENSVPSVRELWKTMNSWVFKGFDETYRRMGIEFAHTYLESETYLLGKDLIQEELEKGSFQKRADGAIIVDLGKMGTKVLLRADGTSVYITQDIGTTVKKYADYTPDSQIWVVGDEQILHFKMLFDILKKMDRPWAENLYHLSYGMVNLPTGKMKSREGTVVDADDLFNEMVSLAKSATLERCGENVPKDIDKRSEIIGMGALKFMLLKFNPKTTMLFDPQASVRFEGDTGPYVQYACARINSIQRKSVERNIDVDKESPDWQLLASEEEKKVATAAFFYPRALRLAAEKMDSSILVNYLLDFSKAFSRFYRECSVLNADDEKLRDTRLALCYRCRDILADGLKTLTIDVPDAM